MQLPAFYHILIEPSRATSIRWLIILYHVYDDEDTKASQAI